MRTAHTAMGSGAPEAFSSSGVWIGPVDADPTWVLDADAERSFERVHESLLTVADGCFGTRGAREENGPGTTPMVLAAGLYEIHDDVEQLLECPLWSTLVFDAGKVTNDRRRLDLRRGLLVRDVDLDGQRVRSVRFSSLARPGVMGLRAEAPLGRIDAGAAMFAPHGTTVEAGEAHDCVWMVAASNLAGGVTASAAQHQSNDDDTTRIERIAAYVTDHGSCPSPDVSTRRLDSARSVGFDALLDEHVDAWQGRWDTADVLIDGDDELQQAVRFSLFHLMGAVRTDGEAPVGARGLSGPNYAGHVFWDADVYVLPFLAATFPAAARNMIAYRVARLGEARREAAACRHAGALFPWESASTGREVTPQKIRHDDGSIEPIRTGIHEEHIVADIAWAAANYAAWTADESFVAGDGRLLLTETARYWASRIRRDRDGAHLFGVIGPDEYRDVVDDNAYTNVMARWNLRQAAAIERRLGGQRPEVERWEQLADELVDGYDPRTGIFEQSAGFFDLEPLVISELCELPVAADLLLGRERLRGAQVIKQPDVLMLHHLVPDEVPTGSLEANLDFYLPRTAHGSSLSPAICASLLARARRPDDALALLEMACRIDLDDLTGTTAGGLNLAAMGGVWQALVFGFAGVRPVGDELHIDPCLPSTWASLQVRVCFGAAKLVITIRDELIEITASNATRVVIGAVDSHHIDVGDNRFVAHAGCWQRRAT